MVQTLSSRFKKRGKCDPSSVVGLPDASKLPLPGPTRRRTRVLGLIALLPLLAACSTGITEAEQSNTEASSVSSPATESPTPAPSPTPTPTPSPTAPPAFGIGDTLENGGVSFTVHDAREAATITVNDSNYRQGSGLETYSELAPTSGGKYYVVDATIENVGKQSMDLTCGYPVAVKVIDDQSREFDLADDLYEIKGNPGCNDSIQPGFSADITYAFVVPSDAHVVGMFFHGTQGSSVEDESIFTFDSNYTLSVS